MTHWIMERKYNYVFCVINQFTIHALHKRMVCITSYHHIIPAIIMSTASVCPITAAPASTSDLLELIDCEFSHLPHPSKPPILIHCFFVFQSIERLVRLFVQWNHSQTFLKLLHPSSLLCSESAGWSCPSRSKSSTQKRTPLRSWRRPTQESARLPRHPQTTTCQSHDHSWWLRRQLDFHIPRTKLGMSTLLRVSCPMCQSTLMTNPSETFISSHTRRFSLACKTLTWSHAMMIAVRWDSRMREITTATIQASSKCLMSSVYKKNKFISISRCHIEKTKKAKKTKLGSSLSKNRTWVI